MLTSIFYFLDIFFFEKRPSFAKNFKQKSNLNLDNIAKIIFMLKNINLILYPLKR